MPKWIWWFLITVLALGALYGMTLLICIDNESHVTDLRQYGNLSHVTYMLFANGEKYMQCAKDQKAWAMKRGFSDIRVLTGDDLDQSFREENAAILKYKKGAGLWLWKSYLILKIMNTLPEEHVVIYSDACSRPDETLTDLIERAQNFGIAGYEAFQQNKYVAPSCFRAMNAEDQLNDDSLIQRWSTVVAFSNTARVREFVQEWYHWCQKEDVIAADAFGDKPKHCHDQSIFSVLTHKRRIGHFTTTRLLGHHAFDRSSYKRALKRLFSRW